MEKHYKCFSRSENLEVGEREAGGMGVYLSFEGEGNEMISFASPHKWFRYDWGGADAGEGGLGIIAVSII